MTRALWLPDILRSAGMRVSEVPGWEQRGTDTMKDLRGILLHHTAGPRDGNYPSLPVVRDGRPDLDGPLAQLGLARDGTWLVIASGRANHAGRGSLPWLPADFGNTYLLGVEAESTGGGDWTVEQIHAYPAGVAAILRHLGLPAERAAGHKEYTSRKIDPAGWPGDMSGFRTAVASMLANAPSPPPDVAAAPLEEPVSPIPLPVVNGLFRATVMAETGPASLLVDRAWLTLGATWGDVHFRVTALGDGKTVLLVKDMDVANNSRAVVELPAGTVMATIEGHVAAPGAIPAAALVSKAK